MSKIIKLTEDDLKNMIHEAINILSQKPVCNESYGETRIDSEDPNHLAIFDKALADRVENAQFKELADNIRKLQNLCEELLNPSRFDIHTIVEFLTPFFERVETSLDDANMQLETLKKVENEIIQVKTFYQQGNMDEMHQHGNRLLIYVQSIGDAIQSWKNR